MYMEEKNFKVTLYYSGFCTYVITAKEETQAILKARNLPIKKDEILSNLESCEDLDEVIEIKDGKSKI